MDALAVDPGPLSVAYALALDRLARMGFPAGLWNRSPEIWPDEPGVRETIAGRLGWLSALDFIEPRIDRLQACAASVRADGFTDVVLLGMGGSSLAPEVLRQVLGVAPGYPRFRMLDSVDPDAVRAAMAHAPTSLFIFASKSGSTIEPNVMVAEARRHLLDAGHEHWGARFVAITDEGTSAHRRAIEERFREIFVNPSDIGGRYSALSFFGMVPAALMGADLHTLVARARDMERACRDTDVAGNPGLALGALMAAAAGAGRDKLTLQLPARLASLGLWVEQLVAESTGKAGKGVVPITGEPPGAPVGDDRFVVTIAVGGEAGGPGPQTAHGLPAARIALPDVHSIGAEFFRWEVATTAAGVLLDINPFDEPNVQQAKDATRALLDRYATERRLPVPEPLASLDGARLSLSRAAEEGLETQDPLAFLRLARRGDYVCLLAYVAPDDAAFETLVGELRAAVAGGTGCATMFGYGPRYLHSTGQLHKGGPNTGVFIVLAAEPHPDLTIPGEPFTFGVLEMAQAVGDFQSLDRAGRRALFVHLPTRESGAIRRVFATLGAAC
jgi:glucose-6-phosphate isomerase